MLYFKHMLEKDAKKEIISKFTRGKGDTGSPEVQVAILTERIKELSIHLKEHKKDNSSRRGLVAMTVKRRNLLKFLEKSNKKRFQEVISDLKI